MPEGYGCHHARGESPSRPWKPTVTTGDVRGFLHVCCIGNYREVTWEIVHALLESRLYDRSAAIDVGLLGSPAEQRVIEEMLAPFERFRITVRSADVDEYEFPTLGVLQDACQTWDGPVYYLHTKGVSYSPVNQYSRYWRRLMLDWIVTNHERCLADLSKVDTVGVNWSGDHYSGNFWWARSSHIRRLPHIRDLRLNPREISRDESVDGRPASGRGMGSVWNTRLQCEHWLQMAPARVGVVGPRRKLHLYRELCWTVSADQIVAELVDAMGAEHVAELTEDDPVAEQPPHGGYDVIRIDLRDDPAGLLSLIERSLEMLSGDGAVVVRHSNPPSAWHQRPAAEFTPGSEWTGQVWRAVAAFRDRHPSCQVFTVDTDWGVTVIRPSRRPLQPSISGSVDDLGWAEFANRRAELLNLVDVAWFRRYLYAEPYLAGSARPSNGTDLSNIVIAAEGLDSYLRIGAATGEELTTVIAPIRHEVDPENPSPGGGYERYDVIRFDGTDFAQALTRLSDRGWIIHRGRAVADMTNVKDEFDCWTIELDDAYTLLHRRVEGMRNLPDELRGLFCASSTDPAPPAAAHLATQPYAGDRTLLLSAVDLDPDDLRSVLDLGDICFTTGDLAAARTWYSQALGLTDWWWSGFDDRIYVAMVRIAEAMAGLGEPWPEVRDAYLRAWEFRPDRIWPLYTIAAHYRSEKRYQLGYLYAKAAAEIPPAPTADTGAGAFHWRVRDELAVCASWTGRRVEAFTLWRDLLGGPDLPDDDRTRIAANRDSCVSAMLEASSAYPDATVRALAAGTGDPRVTVSIVLGPLRIPAEHALNSFLNCCLDINRVGRFLAVDAGLSPADRAVLEQRYGFLEFAPPGTADLADIRALIDSPLWLHLGSGWRFFAPDALLSRMQAVLSAEPRVCGVGVNLSDAAQLTGISPTEQQVRRAPGTGRYVLTSRAAGRPVGPAMYDTARLDRAGASGTATLDEVLCVQQTLVTVIGRGNSGTRAIARTLIRSGVFMGAPIKKDSADLVPAEDMYEACRIISRYIPWRGGLEWDFGPVQTMPIPAEFTGLVERYLDSVLSSTGASAGWKLPETTLCYPWIRRLLPDIRYIFWVRNPLDCITKHHFTDDLRDFGIEYPPTDDPYLRRAISWKYQDDLVAATPRPRHEITVRLEDFVRHQDRELKRLNDFLGLELANIPVREDPIDRHKRTPGVPFPDFLKPAMRRYGYSVTADRN